jgi:ELWxxDGT repeat protein
MHHSGQAHCEPLERRMLLVGTLVRDIFPGGDSKPQFLTASGGLLYFSADDGVHGRELWRSDGTAKGTAMVRDIAPGSVGSNPDNLFDLNGLLLFVAHDGFGSSMWRSDGTASGTYRLGPIEPVLRGDLLGDPDVAAVLGDNGFFRAAGGLWRTDGTIAGTRRVKQVSESEWGVVVRVGARVVFGVGDSIWASDGSTAGTVMLMRHQFPHPIRSTGSRGFFGRLWTTDGTSAGTHFVIETNYDIFGTSVTSNGKLFWGGPRDSTYRSHTLWVSDGRATGTRVAKPGGASPEYAEVLVDVGGVVFFRSRNPQNELWRSDGTPAGTYRIAPVPFGDYRTRLVVADTLFLRGGDLLWRSEGSAAGTAVVPGLTPWARPNGYPLELAAVEGTVFIAAQDRAHGIELWKLPPTPASLTGMLYNDANGNRRLDSGEQRLAGIRVFADANGNGRYDAAEPASISSVRGEYRVVGISPGTTRLRIDGSTAWAIPLGSLPLRVSPGQVRRAHVPLEPAATITGRVFRDGDNDGRLDAGDGGLSAWRIFIDTDDDGVLDANEPNVLTDLRGAWIFRGLFAGTYHIRALDQANWRRTTAQELTTSVRAGQIIGGHLFGFHPS